MAAGPCVENSNCIHLVWDDPAVRADLVLSPDCDNDLVCQANGLYHQSQIAKFYDATYNALQTPVAPGVTISGFGYNINLDAYAYFGGVLGTPYPVSKPDTLTYKNTSCHNQWVEYQFIMPQTTYRVMNGWDVTMGLSVNVSGCALIPVVSSLRECNGFYTGHGTTARAYVPFESVPMGVTFPPTSWGGRGIVQPGETLTVTRRLYFQVDARGTTSGNPDNVVWTLLNPSTSLKVFTWR